VRQIVLPVRIKSVRRAPGCRTGSILVREVREHGYLLLGACPGVERRFQIACQLQSPGPLTK
jgi:hypothetical protein